MPLYGGVLCSFITPFLPKPTSPPPHPPLGGGCSPPPRLLRLDARIGRPPHPPPPPDSYKNPRGPPPIPQCDSDDAPSPPPEATPLGHARHLRTHPPPASTQQQPPGARAAHPLGTRRIFAPTPRLRKIAGPPPPPLCGAQRTFEAPPPPPLFPPDAQSRWPRDTSAASPKTRRTFSQRCRPNPPSGATHLPVKQAQFLKIIALSFIFCFSVVCDNTSLRYLPVSFNQAVGATTPFFTAVFTFLITCRTETAPVYLALVPVVLGIVVANSNKPLFHLFGFLVCVGSTTGRALKFVVQGILLTSDAEKLHSMNLLLYMPPPAAFILLPFTLYIEGNVLAFTLEKGNSCLPHLAAQIACPPLAGHAVGPARLLWANMSLISLATYPMRGGRSVWTARYGGQLRTPSCDTLGCSLSLT
ncbi:hypothetical protein Fmac_005490 [Flemingia macrophylla]|uniref:Sugar phosphate transporter domain-containing protein n=1 Tax=Flemingia macrophylla TaxID=520843 RepID=A0ABD1N7W3_9FABA